MTRWLDYEPEQVDFDYWGMLPLSANHRVALWPKPGSARTDARFRMQHGNNCHSSAQRFLLRIRHNAIVDPPTAAIRDFWLIMDLEAIEGGHIEGFSEPNPDGLVVRMSAQSMELLPDQQVPGVLVEIELSLQDNGSVIYWEEYRNDGGFTNWLPEVENYLSGPNANGWITDPLWTYGEYEQKLQSASECYDFPRQSGLDPGFAEFNGVDSYIALSHSVNAFSLPFRVTCEFRYRDPHDWQPIWGNHDAGGFFGLRGNLNIFGTLSIPTSWNPIVDRWLTYRYDFEQTGQLGHQLYIDDIVRMDAVTNRQFMQANRIGVYREGGIGVLWAHMDVRNLLYRTGTVGNFTTVLDMPLQENALDLGPQANHGTTFNMDLPSV